MRKQHREIRACAFLLAACLTAAAFTEPLTATVYASSSSIPSDAVTYNGHNYYIYSLDSVTTWEEAEEYCESLGGYLACITTEGENDFLYEYITGEGYTSAYFGISDADEEGTWKWVSGETVSYTNWASNEPNGENSSEDYGMFYWKYEDGTWNDGDFGYSTNGGGRAFICEWGSVSVSAPAQAVISSVTSKSYNSIKITWKQVSNVDGYRIYYKTSSGEKKYIAQVSSGSTTSYTHKKVTTGKKYTYYVRAYRNSAGKKIYGSYSKAVSGKAIPAKVTLKSVKKSGTTATIKWSKVSGASGYRIYYRTSKSGKWKVLKTVSGKSTVSYKATGLTRGKTYYFRVRAYRTVSGKKVFGKYSSTKKVTIAKINQYVKTGTYDENNAWGEDHYIYVKKLSSSKVKVQLATWNGHADGTEETSNTKVITTTVFSNKTSTVSFTLTYNDGTKVSGKMKLTFADGYLKMKYKTTSMSSWTTRTLYYTGSSVSFL